MMLPGFLQTFYSFLCCFLPGKSIPQVQFWGAWTQRDLCLKDPTRIPQVLSWYQVGLLKWLECELLCWDIQEMWLSQLNVDDSFLPIFCCPFCSTFSFLTDNFDQFFTIAISFRDDFESTRDRSFVTKLIEPIGHGKMFQVLFHRSLPNSYHLFYKKFLKSNLLKNIYLLYILIKISKHFDIMMFMYVYFAFQ